MSKILRATQKIFGLNAGLNEIGQFGSLAAGSPAYATTPAQVQALANYLQGWFGAVLGSDNPSIEDMNAVHFLFGYQLAYLMQSGIPEYDSATVYYIGSLVNSAGTTYVSLTDNNTGNALTSNANWKVQNGGVRTVTTTASALLTDDVIRADATSGSFVITLPAVATAYGKKIVVKCINSNGNTVTVVGNGAELIDFGNAYQALASLDSANFYCNGTSWDVI